jgi:hypothetical protein
MINAYFFYSPLILGVIKLKDLRLKMIQRLLSLTKAWHRLVIDVFKCIFTTEVAILLYLKIVYVTKQDAPIAWYKHVIVSPNCCSCRLNRWKVFKFKFIYSLKSLFIWHKRYNNYTDIDITKIINVDVSKIYHTKVKNKVIRILI